MASRKSLRIVRGGDWMSDMVRAIIDADELEALQVSVEDAGKAIAKHFFPVIKKHIAFTVGYNKDCFEGALVDEITQGEGPISCLELLEKVKQATIKIKELVGITQQQQQQQQRQQRRVQTPQQEHRTQMGTVSSQSEKMHELEQSLAQANEYLEEVEAVKEDAVIAARHCKEFAKKEEQRFPKTSKAFVEQLKCELREEVAIELAEQTTAASALVLEEKEVQTDEVTQQIGSTSTQQSATEAVPTAPPQDPQPAEPNADEGSDRLGCHDRQLLKTCIEEIRHLTSLLGDRAGGPLSVDVSRGVGPSDGVSGVIQGSVFEHVPLMTLRLSPISRTQPQRIDAGTAMSPRLSRISLGFNNPCPTHRAEFTSTDRHTDAAAPPATEATAAAAAAAAPWTASPLQQPRAASAGDRRRSTRKPSLSTAPVVQISSPQQPNFVVSHLLSASPPEELSFNSREPQLSSKNVLSGHKDSSGATATLKVDSAKRDTGLRGREKVQISFAETAIVVPSEDVMQEDEGEAEPEGGTETHKTAETEAEAGTHKTGQAQAEESKTAEKAAEKQKIAETETAAEKQRTAEKETAAEKMKTAETETATEKQKTGQAAETHKTAAAGGAAAAATQKKVAEAEGEAEKQKTAVGEEALRKAETQPAASVRQAESLLQSRAEEGQPPSASSPSASPKRQQPCAQEVNEVSLQPAALCSPNSSASSSQGPSDKNKDSAESVAAARGVHTPQVSSKAEPPPAAAESNDSSPQRHLQEAEDKPNEPENILRCQGARQHEDHPVEQSLPFNASNCQQEVINPEDSRPEGHSCFQTRETNMCVSPELIFGKQSPCLWPLLTGGPKWSQSHQTRKIPLAPFIRQNRGTSEESTNSSAAAIHCKSLPRPGSCRGAEEGGKREMCGEASRGAQSPEFSMVFIPLKGSKLGPVKPKLARKGSRNAADSCKALLDLRIRNQVLESQVLGLSVALGQAHERLNTLTRVCDKLAGGVAGNR